MDFEKWIKLGSFLIALVGVPLFFYKEYSETNRLIRAHTVSFVDEYRSGEVFDARMRMLKKWREIPLIDVSERMPSRAVIDKLVGDIMSSDERFFEDFIILVNFFDSVALCVQIDRCDGGVVQSAMGKDIVTFRNLYSGSVQALRKELLISNFGIGMEALN